MAVLNTHERRLPGSAAEVGALLDSLASGDDRLWPRDRWPAMRFGRPLGAGAAGGHGMVRYTIDSYVPGRWIRFTFTRPTGFRGFHEFTVHENGHGATLRHTMAVRLCGSGRLLWPLLFRWLHDALLEDCLDRAELAVTGRVPDPARWSPMVRALRHLALRTNARRTPRPARPVRTH
ncbi:hypothetical protein SAMN05421810_11464 [Amycolatopsis arida]|uniref:Polyketide cyclase / dehydrase and lipid transport n=1 Tax=Amycolatopsis arida TaxID=587909 RepID=A0A1I6ASE9_9PSEU|nr:hypothetical protein [Amycolatopsis arida]TDX97559.1 hypothetical protein CLV69_102663 [Amycolatopsis arida]SFQ71556.1 hypothetical protein SAMN05421810_11464 [Amycolatopsis arida]